MVAMAAALKSDSPGGLSGASDPRRAPSGGGPANRGALAVVLVTAMVVIAALCLRLILSDVPAVITGIFIGVPIGALSGWLTDQAIRRIVDAYFDLVGRGR